MQATTSASPAPIAEKFPNVFWTANVTELFERAAYYSMASFVVIYLGQLGFGAYWPSFLNRRVLWTLVYFLPILSGTIADQIGFRRALLVAFVLLAAGYFLMGYPVWLGGSELSRDHRRRGHGGDPRRRWSIVAAILLIGVGGSVIKPCISGTVQKTAGARATLGFAIFYMVINIGSLFGRGTAFVVRSGSGVGDDPRRGGDLRAGGRLRARLPGLQARPRRGTREGSVWPATAGFTAIVVAAGVRRSPGSTARGRGARRHRPRRASRTSSRWPRVASVVAFFVVLFFYREPAAAAGTPAKPKRSIGRILLDMVLVLGNGRFTLFLVVMTGFFFIYNQVYNVLPLYVKRVVETSPAMDLYTAANPFVIVCFQLLDHARLRQDEADPLDGRRHRDHRRRDAHQPGADLRGRRRRRRSSPTGCRSARCSSS